MARIAIPRTTTKVHGPQPRSSCNRSLIHCAKVGIYRLGVVHVHRIVGIEFYDR